MSRLLLAMSIVTVAGGLWCSTAAFAADEAPKKGEVHGKAAADGKEGDHKEGSHPEGPITWRTDLALWSLITFVLFIAILTKFAWTPLALGLSAREQRIHDDIAAAEQSRIKAEQLLADHARKLEKVQDEVKEIVAEARRDAEHTKQDIMAEAQREAEATKQRAIAEINRARDGALKELFDVMSTQVASATEHVLGRSLTPADQDRLINEALAEFSSSK